MAGKLIVITGLDGSGTSTLASALAERDPGSFVYKTPSSPYDACRHTIDEQVREKSQPAHYLFYLSSVVFASKEIEELLTQGNVYCVRYLIDTVVSHRAAGLDVNLEYRGSFFSIRPPDLTIMIELDEDVRQTRIEARGKGFLDRLLDEDTLRARFTAEFKRLSHHYVTVENSGSDIDATVRSAIKHIPWIN
jgi:thymidylate kinase